MRKLVRSVWETSLDIVYPRTCVRCGRLVSEELGRYTCATCRRSIRWIQSPICDICGVPFFGKISSPRRCADCVEKQPRFGRARSVFLYRGTGARIVHALKYEKGVWLEREIGSLLEGNPVWQAYFEGKDIVPVPLHPKKHRSRGYNQSEIIARAIQGVFPEVKVVRRLRRVRITTSQTSLTREERLRNMRGAFVCADSSSNCGKVVLVDDVLTTGATLNAAALALKRGGAEEISAFTLAHG